MDTSSLEYVDTYTLYELFDLCFILHVLVFSESTELSSDGHGDSDSNGPMVVSDVFISCNVHVSGFTGTVILRTSSLP